MEVVSSSPMMERSVGRCDGESKERRGFFEKGQREDLQKKKRGEK